MKSYPQEEPWAGLLSPETTWRASKMRFVHTIFMPYVYSEIDSNEDKN